MVCLAVGTDVDCKGTGSKEDGCGEGGGRRVCDVKAGEGGCRKKRHRGIVENWRRLCNRNGEGNSGANNHLRTFHLGHHRTIVLNFGNQDLPHVFVRSGISRNRVGSKKYQN